MQKVMTCKGYTCRWSRPAVELSSEASQRQNRIVRDYRVFQLYFPPYLSRVPRVLCAQALYAQSTTAGSFTKTIPPRAGKAACTNGGQAGIAEPVQGTIK